MKTGLESLDTGASNITYSGNEGPKSPQQIAEADFMLLEEYQKYVFEMEEMGLEPMSFEQFRQEAMAGMAMGGRAGYASGQLVKPTRHGVRPGYRGDAAYRSYSASSVGKDRGAATRSEVGGGKPSRNESSLADLKREKAIANQATSESAKAVKFKKK